MSSFSSNPPNERKPEEVLSTAFLPSSWCTLMNLTSLTVSIDLEWYDQSNGNIILEIGLAIVPNENSELAVNYHWILQENCMYVNRFCKTSPLGFIFGRTERIPIAEAVKRLRYWFQGAGFEIPVRLVAHDPRGDLKALKLMGIDVLSRDKISISDTQVLFKSMSLKNKPSLSAMCRELEIEINERALHNAGNDAHYTLLAYQKVMFLEGSALKQKEEIQPGISLTGRGVGGLMSLSSFSIPIINISSLFPGGEGEDACAVEERKRETVLLIGKGLWNCFFLSFYLFLH